MIENYDYEEYLNHSPGLEPVHIKYAPSPSPPPFPLPPTALSKLASSTSGPQMATARRIHIRPSLGDMVLLRQMAPNLPDVAIAAGQRALNSHPASEAGDSEEVVTDSLENPSNNATGVVPEESKTQGNGPGVVAKVALAIKPVETEVIEVDASVSNVDVVSRVLQQEARPSIHDDNASTKWHDSQPNSMPRDGDDTWRPKSILEAAAETESPGASLSPESKKRAAKVQLLTSDSIANSPRLQVHLISASDRSPSKTLAAFITDTSLQNSPHESPKQNIQLPSVRPLVEFASQAQENEMHSSWHRPRTSSSLSTISTNSPQSLPPFSPAEAGSPVRFPRSTFFDPGKLQQSPIAARITLDGPLQQHFWGLHESVGGKSPNRTLLHSATGSSDTSRHSLGTSSSTEGYSSSSHPTPSDMHTGEHTPRPSLLPSPYIQPHEPSAEFKCKHEGCTAPPFNTQYLLNSHRNVHSQERNHYCPMKDCPRSRGGRGFKRKNEMIRHGLVHESPGYVCPYCRDKEHRYPRPDNLQRHVRMHHEDMDKDDQKLKDVLAQRPAGGSSRGRRRRA